MDQFVEGLPKDSRSLIGCIRRCSGIDNVPPGKYYHFGIEKNLKTQTFNTNTSIIQLAIGIDGLPLSKSSKSQFWPILGSCLPIRDNGVFMIGLYWGDDKPSDCNLFLKPFVEEVKILHSKGFQLHGKSFTVQVSFFACDAVAKSYILKTKGHGAYSSCSKCTVSGKYECGRVTFPIKIGPLRNHDDFVNKVDTCYHHTDETSIIIEIPQLNVVQAFPLDYLHLICIGVVKKLLMLLLFNAPHNLRMSKKSVTEMNKRIATFSTMTPCEFGRKCRDFSEVKRWKAIEFRTFLIYIGMCCFHGLLKQEQYDNFMLLSVACHCFLNPCSTFNGCIAKKMMQDFVHTFSQIYGSFLVSHNVHGLLHVYDDYKVFGCLDSYSTFPFENFLQKIKNALRKREKPLEQIVKRHSEGLFLMPPRAKGFKKFLLSHTNGPLIDNSNCCKQFRVYNSSAWKLKTFSYSEKDCYILTKSDEIMQVHNIIEDSEGKAFVLGFMFEDKANLFQYPIPSSVLNIYQLSKISSTLLLRDLECLSQKIFMMKLNQKYISVPIMHTGV